MIVKENVSMDALRMDLMELILTKDGRLFADADCQKEIERFCAFYQNNLCARDREDMYCYGKLPEQSKAGQRLAAG